MNYKITTEQHNLLCKLEYKEYLFGSHLHGIATKDSDKDYIRIIGDEFYDRFKTLSIYYPNIHSFQYDDVDNNTQYVWMTTKQFYHNLFSGDGNMVADVVLLSGEWDNAMQLCYTYKIIKGYLGVAKRDLKMHGNNPKKRFHAYRSLMMAENLMNKRLPTVSDIINLKNSKLHERDVLLAHEVIHRNNLNILLSENKISHYPVLDEPDDLVKTMVACNNIVEFRYE